MELSEEEKLKGDILFQIDMQLYDEFNDKLCEINEHLGDIYSYKDLQDIENAEKDKERILLREAIKKQQKEIEKIKDKNKTLEGLLQGNLFELYLYYKELASKYQANSISKDKIREKIKEITNYNYTSVEERDCQVYARQVLKELLEEE